MVPRKIIFIAVGVIAIIAIVAVTTLTRQQSSNTTTYVILSTTDNPSAVAQRLNDRLKGSGAVLLCSGQLIMVRFDDQAAYLKAEEDRLLDGDTIQRQAVTTEPEELATFQPC